MNRQRIKRNFYRYPKYYHTALRYMVEIYRAPKPKSLDHNYEFYKTQRKYIIDTYYTVFDGNRPLKKIPIQISLPILSKERGDLRITMGHNYWPYRKQVQDELLAYFGHLKEKKRPGA